MHHHGVAMRDIRRAYKCRRIATALSVAYMQHPTAQLRLAIVTCLWFFRSVVGHRIAINPVFLRRPRMLADYSDAQLYDIRVAPTSQAYWSAWTSRTRLCALMVQSAPAKKLSSCFFSGGPCLVFLLKRSTSTVESIPKSLASFSRHSFFVAYQSAVVISLSSTPFFFSSLVSLCYPFLFPPSVFISSSYALLLPRISTSLPPRITLIQLLKTILKF